MWIASDRAGEFRELMKLDLGSGRIGGWPTMGQESWVPYLAQAMAHANALGCQEISPVPPPADTDHWPFFQKGVPAFAATIPAKSNITAVTVYTDRAVVTRTATVDLAVSRSPAAGDPIGSLLLNPGGPGASGVEFVQGFVGGGLPDGLDGRFDIVSWDPRGTTGETRVDRMDGGR